MYGVTPLSRGTGRTSSRTFGFKSGSKSLTIVLLGGYLIVALILSIMFLGGYVGFTNRTATTQMFPLTIVSSASGSRTMGLEPYHNSTTIVGALSFGFTFNLTSTSRVAGNFTSTNGVSFFILPSSADSLFVSSLNAGSPEYFTYTTGTVAAGTLDITLPPGSYEIVIVDLASQPTVVTLNTSIAAYALSD